MFYPHRYAPQRLRYEFGLYSNQPHLVFPDIRGILDDFCPVLLGRVRYAADISTGIEKQVRPDLSVWQSQRRARASYAAPLFAATWGTRDFNHDVTRIGVARTWEAGQPGNSVAQGAFKIDGAGPRQLNHLSWPTPSRRMRRPFGPKAYTSSTRRWPISIQLWHRRAPKPSN